MRSGSLWRHRDFRYLWLGQAVSEIGSVATRTALPIAAVLLLEAGALEMGLLVVASSAAVLLVGLAAGAWVDRLPRRQVLIATDVGRALALVTIPTAAMAGALRIELLYVVAFATAALGSFFDAAYRSYPPLLVRREQLNQANSALAGASSAAELTGPSLGGAIVQLATAPIAILIDALSFMFSAASPALIRTPEPRTRATEDRAPLAREIRAGLAFLWHERSLRVIALSAVVGSFFGNFFASLYTLYALDELALSPLVLGIIISAGGAGSLAAAVVAGPVARRIGIGPTIVWCEVISALVYLLIPLAAELPLLAALFLFIPQLVGDGIANVGMINAITFRQLVTPNAMLGRVSATMHVLNRGIAPAGAMIGALIAEAAGIRLAVWVGVLGVLVGALLMFLPSPLLRTREIS